jgi:hypothetical protein
LPLPLQSEFGMGFLSGAFEELFSSLDLQFTMNFTSGCELISLLCLEWGSRVRFQEGAGNFSLHHQNGSGAYPASYPMATRGSFPGGKAIGT